ncbi:MAG: hypothetical protein R2794_06765 [Chitinophagales bacterium]
MNRILELLQEYEDFELAFLVKYKLHAYLPETGKMIQAYIASRGMNEKRIRELIAEYTTKKFEDDHLRCPRCKSKKRIVEDIVFYNTDKRTSMDVWFDHPVKVKQVKCQVCEYLIKNPNSEKLGPQ